MLDETEKAMNSGVDEGALFQTLVAITRLPADQLTQQLYVIDNKALSVSDAVQQLDRDTLITFLKDRNAVGQITDSKVAIQCALKVSDGLQYASPELLNSRDFAIQFYEAKLATYTPHPDAAATIPVFDGYQFFGEEVRADDMIMEYALQYERSCYKHFPSKLKADKDFLRQVIKRRTQLAPSDRGCLYDFVKKGVDESLWSDDDFLSEILIDLPIQIFDIPYTSTIWQDAELLKFCISQGANVAILYPRIDGALWVNEEFVTFCLDSINRPISNDEKGLNDAIRTIMEWALLKGYKPSLTVIQRITQFPEVKMRVWQELDRAEFPYDIAEIAQHVLNEKLRFDHLPPELQSEPQIVIAAIQAIKAFNKLERWAKITHILDRVPNQEYRSQIMTRLQELGYYAKS